MWQYIAVGVIAIAALGGAYGFGRVQTANHCVASIQAYDEKVLDKTRKEATAAAALREESLKRVIIKMDTAYQQQATKGAQLSAELSAARETIHQQSRTFAERIRKHVSVNPSCTIGPDVVRMLNEGLAVGGPPAGPAPAAPGVPPTP